MEMIWVYGCIKGEKVVVSICMVCVRTILTLFPWGLATGRLPGGLLLERRSQYMHDQVCIAFAGGRRPFADMTVRDGLRRTTVVN